MSADNSHLSATSELASQPLPDESTVFETSTDFLGDLALQEAREYAENIVETVREPLVVLNSELKVMTANQSFYDTFKVAPEETIGNFIYDLGNRQWDIPALRVLFEEILPNNTVFNNYEVEHDFPGIGKKNILLNAREIFRKKIGSHIILLAMEDITVRKLLEREIQAGRELAESNLRLVAVSRAKSDFLANMSHELRTPLNSVIGFSEVLQDQLHGPINKKQHEYVGNILNSGKHLLALINDILDLAKVESDMMELELSVFSLRKPIDAAILMLKEKILRSGVTVHLEIDCLADMPVIADLRKLKQIMFNLLSNAVKFTAAGGTVNVSAAITDVGLLEISVVDSGIGIKPEDIPLLFQKFTQLEPAYTKEYAGSGLGLALARQLVELHGGTIRVESVFGSGSSFRFTIPQKQ